MDSVLRQGSKGIAVIELQQLLQNKGFYSGKVDGDFGSGTTNAVLKFQKANALTTDGIMGDSSWTKLRAVNPTTPSALPSLLPGSKGAAVAKAQQLLKDKGFYQGRVDGDFGAVTRDAIAAFQRANGLAVDGKVGDQTWKKLQFTAIASPPISAPTTTPTSEIPIGSIFVPPLTEVIIDKPINTIPFASAISLVDAANSYSRAKLPSQTAAINNLQTNTNPEILQQFLQRWQIASGLTTPATSLQDAFSNYNSAQMLNQNLALQWLQGQLLPQAIVKFREDWSNLTTGIDLKTPLNPMPPIAPIAANNPQIQLINLTDAIKGYTRLSNQVTALEKLQASIPETTMQQFFQRWALASEQNAIAVSLLEVFKDYDGKKFPSQVTALQWLEKELTTANLEQFSQDWLA
ncbi:peptidoglycan-binding protein [Pseudanabaena biceps]|nr:peptidoglycan-binding protein [Pseudanabaena biceps]